MEMLLRLLLIAVIATAIGSVRAAPAAQEGVQIGIEDDEDDELIGKRDDDDDEDDALRSSQNRDNVADDKLRRGRPVAVNRPQTLIFLPRCMECRRGLAMRILSVRLSVCMSHA